MSNSIKTIDEYTLSEVEKEFRKCIAKIEKHYDIKYLYAELPGGILSRVVWAENAEKKTADFNAYAENLNRPKIITELKDTINLLTQALEKWQNVSLTGVQDKDKIVAIRKFGTEVLNKIKK